MKDLTITGYNSHDCHVMINVFLAIAIRAIKLVFVKMVITRMCYFFNTISKKVIDCVELLDPIYLWPKLRPNLRCASLHPFLILWNIS